VPAAGAVLVAVATVVAFVHLAVFAVFAPAVVCAVVPELVGVAMLWAGVGWELEFPEFSAFPVLPEEPSAAVEEPTAGADVCCVLCGGLEGAVCG
jgi:hypothetical protein